MPRPRVHESNAAKQKGYRDRAGSDRKAILELQGLLRAGPAVDGFERPTAEWFEVKLSVDRDDGKARGSQTYVMSGAELALLTNDLAEYAANPAMSRYWQYAIADSDGFGTPSWATLHLNGYRLESVRALDDFAPTSSYMITETAVRLFRGY